MKKYYILKICLVFLIMSCNTTINKNNKERSDDSNVYGYSIDLLQADNNQISVELICPKISNETINFYFPAIIPGNYDRVDFGRFIKHFKAFDVDGDELNVKKVDDNCFNIQDANSLYRITYQVSSTYNGRKGKKIPPSSGSIFAKDKVFAFNTSAVFGYFEGYKEARFNLSFNKPDDFYGVTSLSESENTKNLQSFSSESYQELIDCPVLFSKPDTTSFLLDKTLIQIGIYSETGKSSSDIIKNGIKPYLESVRKYYGEELPLKKYSLIIYLKDLTHFKDGIYGSSSLNIFQKMKMSKIHVGALEHGSSSFYFYADAGRPESYLYFMQRTCTHELLHIFTPLNLKSELVANFDFQEPKMSEHLWLYEGVTDYLSWHTKLQTGLIGLDELLNDVMRIKMLIMNKFPVDISFTNWSTKILEDPWSEQYSQVYNKGTITAMFLDFEIMRLTNGQKNLADVIFILSKKFKNKAFKEDEIFNEFSNIVHPELKYFFEKYISGKDNFDFKSAFASLGLDFHEKITEDMPVSTLDGGYGVEMLVERVRVYNIEKVNPGSVFKKGDKILYDVFGEDCRTPFRDSVGNYVKKGSVVELPIIREGMETFLPISVEYAPSTYRYKISVSDSMTKEQEYNFRRWYRNELPIQ
ncbi:MAG: hypothetical protein KKG99_15445 [Bacteroidetes bacterium]|nr:hypothetical protein [Bacteroidota bacterium]